MARFMSPGSSSSHRAAAELPDRDDEPERACHAWNCDGCGKFCSRRTARVIFTPDSDRSVESVEILCPKCDAADRAVWERLGMTRPEAGPAVRVEVGKQVDPEF